MPDPFRWLTVIGLGEDGAAGLCPAARAALLEADSVFGAPRHLALAGVDDRGVAWPVPFSIQPLLEQRGRRVVALVSGDPFWFGAGSTLARALPPEEWRAFPAPSTFSRAAARLGWPLEETTCLGLHAAPFETMLVHLAPGARLLCLLRDGAAPAALAAFLVAQGFGESRLMVLEALGGPRERIRAAGAAAFALGDIGAPVAVAIAVAGGPGLPRVPGLPDDLFAHDGQITKAPVRALTLAALAPRRGERLWDIGAGSGSVSVEWCLAGGRAIAIEAKPSRAGNIRANAARFGVPDRLTLVEGHAPAVLDGLPAPDAVFIGGGADAALLDALWTRLPAGARLVANAVTLETESLLLAAQAEKGGTLLRVELASAVPLGRLRGWQPARPLVQWSVVR